MYRCLSCGNDHIVRMRPEGIVPYIPKTEQEHLNFGPDQVQWNYRETVDDEFEEAMGDERDAAIQAINDNTIDFRLYQRMVNPLI